MKTSTLLLAGAAVVGGYFVYTRYIAPKQTTTSTFGSVLSQVLNRVLPPPTQLDGSANPYDPNADSGVANASAFARVATRQPATDPYSAPSPITLA